MLEDPMRRHHAAEAGLRRQPVDQRAQVARDQRAQLRQQLRTERRQGAERPGSQAGEPPRRVERQPGERGQALEVVHQRQGVELRQARLVRRAVGDARLLVAEVQRLGRQRVQRLEELRPRLAVHDGVVHLAVHGEAARRRAGHVVQPLDDVGLPQRFAAVERPRVQPRHLDAQLSPVARVRQRNVAHVELDVEGRILDPVGTVEGQRHPDQPPAELRELLEARREEAQHVLEAHPAVRRRGGVVDGERGDVHEIVAALELQEHGIGAGELLHGAGCRAARRDRSGVRGRRDYCRGAGASTAAAPHPAAADVTSGPARARVRSRRTPR